MKRDFTAIARKHLPKGVRVIYARDGADRDYFAHRGMKCPKTGRRRKTIRAPWPDTVRGLYIWFHELAHLEHPNAWKDDKPEHVVEYEAEIRALAKMKQEAVPMPRDLLQEVKAYVRGWCKREAAAGITIRKDIARWANWSPK